MLPESPIKLNNNLKSLYIKTAQKLKGSDRRQFMAEVVKSLGRGGQTTVERELGWNRRTIRKGMQELEHGMSIADSFKLMMTPQHLEFRRMQKSGSKLENLIEVEKLVSLLSLWIMTFQIAQL